MVARDVAIVTKQDPGDLMYESASVGAFDEQDVA
jgi:hypothetical protein